MKQAVIDADQSVESGKGNQGLLRLRKLRKYAKEPLYTRRAQSSRLCKYHAELSYVITIFSPYSAYVR